MPVAGHAAHDDVGRLPEQPRAEHDQDDAGDGEQATTDQQVASRCRGSRRAGAGRPEVLALLGRHAGAATGPEAATTGIATGRGEDGLIVGLIAADRLVVVGGVEGLVLAHATAPCPSCDSTISA